ncbi:AI-2E family transporter [Candidatus Skiveiella danica]|uniref:AI-2E family transporter n=1 Tax=Candidatus Skiveiella danica TaxID=3386177 RepID=UPI001E096E52|nr:AI-2E family transporter [Betaproteobacteria bacterium]
MPAPEKFDHDLDQRIASKVTDVFIRLGMVVALVLLCYRAISPFLTLLIWSLILAVALHPLHEAVARKVGGRHGLAATLIAILGLALIVAPSAVLMSSLGDSVHQFIRNVQTNSLAIAAPNESVATWPFIGPKLHAMRSQARRSARAGSKACSRSLATSRSRCSATWRYRRRPAAIPRRLHHRGHHHGVR